MDEHREEREELDALARDDADDAREQEAEFVFWADVSVQFQTTEADAQRCLTRSGIVPGAPLGETLIESVELR